MESPSTFLPVRKLKHLASLMTHTQTHICLSPLCSAMGQKQNACSGACEEEAADDDDYADDEEGACRVARCRKKSKEELHTLRCTSASRTVFSSQTRGEFDADHKRHA